MHATFIIMIAKNQREDNVTKPTKKQKLPDLNRIK